MFKEREDMLAYRLNCIALYLEFGYRCIGGVSGLNYDSGGVGVRMAG
jgi:hypothetical protein